MIRKYFLLLFLVPGLFCPEPSMSQDTLRVMSYNLLNFPNGRNDCGTNLSVPSRWDTLRKIVQYAKPDIFMVCELQTEAGADSILNRALNVGSINYYARANFVVNQSGFNGLNNMFFYNTQKVVLHSQSEIITDLRDIGEYVVYANDPNLNFYQDTNFIRFYVGHLKAGNTNAPVEENRRALECDSLRTHIDGITGSGNFVFGGDFNFYASSEPGYQILTAGGVNKLNDPVNRPGNWNNNSSFADIHTQSTRSSAYIECGAPGGMDDRFDFLLISDSIVSGGDNLQYITGTYKALGNDGNHFNQSLNNPPNTSLPDSVINALYYFSDHLPIVMDLLITYPAAMILSTAQTEITCNGACDGTGTASVAGGSPPYTYQWDDPGLQTTLTATGLCAGTYRFTFTDSTGMTLTDSIVLADPPVLSASFSDSSVISCSGDSSGFAAIGVSGGTAPYTYQWDDPDAQTTATATGLPAGAYTVVITDDRACSDTAALTITQLASTPLSVAVSASVNVLCNGMSAGSATASVSGGTPPYTFTWDDPASQTDSIATALPAGFFAVSVSDSAGCPGTDTVTITQPAAMSFTVIDTGSATCDTANSTASVSVVGGVAPYYYLWSDTLAQTTAIADSLASGTYTVMVTDQNGCVDSAYATISDATAPTLTLTDSTEVKCHGAATGSATVTPVGGTAPYTYSWWPGINTDSVAEFLTAGTYYASVTDSNGCKAVLPVTITEPAVFSAVISDSSDVSCNGNADGAASVTPAGGVAPYTYLWSNGDTDSSAVLPPGVYSIMVTDANGCVANDTLTPSACFEIESILVEACRDTGQPEGYNEMVRFHIGYGSLNTSDLVVNWPNNSWKGVCQNVITSNTVDSINSTIIAGGQVIEPTGGVLPAGAQVMLITSVYFDWTSHDWSGLDYTLYLVFQCDSNKTGHFKNYCSGGCGTRTLEMSLGINCGDTVTYEPGLLLNGGANGNGDGVDFSAAGNPTYVNSGCLPPYLSSFIPPSVTISEPAKLNVLMTDSSNVLCKGDNSGTASTSASGGTSPVTYLWNDPSAQTDTLATGLATGLYTVYATDANGCSDSAGVFINEPADTLAATMIDSLDVLCKGFSTGSAEVSAAGGTSPYTYQWNDSAAQSGAIASGLPAGNYSVTVTDANNCRDSARVSLAEPSVFTIFTTDLVDAHCGQSDGWAIVNSTGGTLPHTYQWDDPAMQTDTLATGLSAGTYTIVFMDAVGCSDSLTLVINDLPGPGINGFFSTVAACAGDSTGTATVDGGGGEEPYAYLWDDTGSQTDSIATGLPAGTYNVTLTDFYGCQATGSTTVIENAPIVLNTTATPASCGLTDGSAGVTASGGSGPYAYLWSDPALQTTAAATGLGFGTYTLVVTDSLGCVDSTTAGVSNTGGPLVTISDSVMVLCNGDSTGSATVTASGGTAPYSYLWDDFNAQTDSLAVGLPAGTYHVNVTDSGGCGSVATVTITQPAPLSLSMATDTAKCQGDSSGSATVVVSGGLTPYSYLWNDAGAQSGISATGLPQGAYTCIVTDSGGCSDFISGTVEEYSAITASVSSSSVSCNGDCDGMLVCVAAGGGGFQFIFAWSDSSNVDTATGLCAGAYSVTVTNTNNCTGMATATVSQPDTLSLITGSTDATCGGANGTASVNVAGGTPPYSYSWNDPGFQSTDTASGLAQGIYSVSVTDQNGCVDSSYSSVNSSGGLFFTIVSTTNASCLSVTNGGADITVSGGVQPYTFLWSNSSTNEDLSGVGPGIYDITITDAAGCASTNFVTVGLDPELSATLIAFPSTCSASGGSAEVTTVIGGIPPYTYVWDDPGSQSGSAASGLAPGTYTVVVSDSSGCAAIDTAIITGGAGPAIDSIAITHESCMGAQDGSVAIYASDGIPPYTYAWDNPDFSASATLQDVPPGAYYVVVLDAQFCGAADSVLVGAATELCLDTMFVPSSFTPNGDLVNDTWIIRGLQNYPDNTVEIYNRWGSLLYSSDGYAEPWDGTYNGQDVASATYYYIIILNETEDPITGSVTVVR